MKTGDEFTLNEIVSVSENMKPEIIGKLIFFFSGWKIVFLLNMVLMKLKKKRFWHFAPNIWTNI